MYLIRTKTDRQNSITKIHEIKDQEKEINQNYDKL